MLIMLHIYLYVGYIVVISKPLFYLFIVIYRYVIVKQYVSTSFRCSVLFFNIVLVDSFLCI